MTKIFQNISLVLAAALTLGFVAPQANADILLEPYLGYHTGKGKQSGNADSTNKGVSFGGRVGYQQLGFMAGLDYMTGSWTSERSGTNYDATPSDLGVFVGFNFPVMLRVYGVYNFASKMTIKPSSGPSDDYKGTGIKLGVGLTTLPFVSINLEYATSTFDKHTANGGGALSPEIKGDMFGLTVSLPLTF